MVHKRNGEGERLGLPQEAIRLFSKTAFTISLDARGLLRIGFTLDSSWSEGQRRRALHELSFHLYHFSQFLCDTLRETGEVPRNAEFRKWMTKISPQPEIDILEFVERATAGLHQEVLETVVTYGLTQLVELARNRRRFVLEAISHGLPWTTSENISRALALPRARLTERRHVLRFALCHRYPQHAERACLVIDRANADLGDLLQRSEAYYASRLEALNAKTGFLIGAVGLVTGLPLAIIPLLVPLSDSFPMAVWSAIAGLILIVAPTLVVIYFAWRGVGSLVGAIEVETKSWLQSYGLPQAAPTPASHVPGETLEQPAPGEAIEPAPS